MRAAPFVLGVLALAALAAPARSAEAYVLAAAPAQVLTRSPVTVRAGTGWTTVMTATVDLSPGTVARVFAHLELADPVADTRITAHARIVANGVPVGAAVRDELLGAGSRASLRLEGAISPQSAATVVAVQVSASDALRWNQNRWDIDPIGSTPASPYVSVVALTNGVDHTYPQLLVERYRDFGTRAAAVAAGAKPLLEAVVATDATGATVFHPGTAPAGYAKTGTPASTLLIGSPAVGDVIRLSGMASVMPRIIPSADAVAIHGIYQHIGPGITTTAARRSPLAEATVMAELAPTRTFSSEGQHVVATAGRVGFQQGVRQTTPALASWIGNQLTALRFGQPASGTAPAFRVASFGGAGIGADMPVPVTGTVATLAHVDVSLPLGGTLRAGGATAFTDPTWPMDLYVQLSVSAAASGEIVASSVMSQCRLQQLHRRGSTHGQVVAPGLPPGAYVVTIAAITELSQPLPPPGGARHYDLSPTPLPFQPPSPAPPERVTVPAGGCTLHVDAFEPF